MNYNRICFLSVPGLRTVDVNKQTTPTLFSWANAGISAELVPTFPCVTSCVQASMFTGLPPGGHGIIANGFYHRERDEVEFWVGRNNLVTGEQIWDVLKARNAGTTSAVWHAQNIKGAGADFIVTPAPIHEPDGTTKLWCYSKPDDLYSKLLADLGHFPLQHYWGPVSNIESTRWILQGALWLIPRHAPNLQWIYIPHLDYAMQKYGPNSSQAKSALIELDQSLAEFAAGVAASGAAADTLFLVAGEYAMTDVTGAIPLNRVLRQAGLVKVKEQAGAEYIDLPASEAFALVDHQVAHVFVQRRSRNQTSWCAELLRNQPGVAAVFVDDERAEVGLHHERSGDIVVIADEDRWFSYYWWFDDAAAPPFARTVDIHRKPGYDPVELFFDPKTRGIPLDASLIKGSHGVPATVFHHRTALISSVPTSFIESNRTYRDTDIQSIVFRLMFGE